MDNRKAWDELVKSRFNLSDGESMLIGWADDRIKALEEAVEWVCGELDAKDISWWSTSLINELRRRAGLLPEDVG